VTAPLLPRIAAGEQAAVEACIERYSGLVWSLARRYLQDSAAAEDAVQEIFIELWKVADRFDPERGSEVAFLGTLVRRRLIDRVRRIQRKKPHLVLDTEPMSETPSIEKRLADREQLRLAKELVEELQPQQRQAVELAMFQGLSHSEVSERLGIPLGSAKALIRRGLHNVRTRYARTTSAGTPA
jgi:RNA polymerase sigma-70 factor (ECF subfamily)